MFFCVIASSSHSLSKNVSFSHTATLLLLFLNMNTIRLLPFCIVPHARLVRVHSLPPHTTLGLGLVQRHHHGRSPRAVPPHRRAVWHLAESHRAPPGPQAHRHLSHLERNAVQRLFRRGARFLHPRPHFPRGKVTINYLPSCFLLFFFLKHVLWRWVFKTGRPSPNCLRFKKKMLVNTKMNLLG